MLGQFRLCNSTKPIFLRAYPHFHPWKLISAHVGLMNWRGPILSVVDVKGEDTTSEHVLHGLRWKDRENTIARAAASEDSIGATAVPVIQEMSWICHERRIC